MSTGSTIDVQDSGVSGELAWPMDTTGNIMGIQQKYSTVFRIVYCSIQAKYSITTVKDQEKSKISLNQKDK